MPSPFEGTSVYELPEQVVLVWRFFPVSGDADVGSCDITAVAAAAATAAVVSPWCCQLKIARELQMCMGFMNAASRVADKR